MNFISEQEFIVFNMTIKSALYILGYQQISASYIIQSKIDAWYKIFVEDEKNTLFESVAVSIPLCSFILYNRLTSKQAPFKFMPKNLFHPLISQECPKAKADMLT